MNITKHPGNSIYEASASFSVTLSIDALRSGQTFRESTNSISSAPPTHSIIRAFSGAGDQLSVLVIVQAASMVSAGSALRRPFRPTALKSR
jgi:hypothetical protein